MFFTFQHFNLFGVYYLSSYVFSSLFTIHCFVLLMFFTFFLSTFCPVQHFVCFLPSAFFTIDIFYHRRFYRRRFLLRHFLRELILLPAEGDCSDWVHSYQMVLGTVRQEAGPQKRWPKVLETKQTQGPSGWSPFRSDVSRDGQAGHCTSWEVAKETQGRVGQTTLESQGT